MDNCRCLQCVCDVVIWMNSTRERKSGIFGQLCHFAHRANLWRRQGSAFSVEVADHVLNNSAQLSIKRNGIIAMDSGDKVRASTDIDLIFLAPIYPFVIFVEFFHFLDVKAPIRYAALCRRLLAPGWASF
jgi:hypothetical protein